MCFSAAASFGSGGILALAGIATLRQGRLPGQWPFAVIPCLFAVQQCAEGLLWGCLTQGESAGWQRAAMYVFLIFAQVVWPFWIPLALQRMAPPERQRPLGIVLGVGCCVATVLAGCLLLYGAEAAIVGHHIAYTLPYPAAVMDICGLLYGVAVIAPPFMTGIRSMWWLGVGIAAAYLLSMIAYQYYVVSVWCYIAALLSVLIYAIQRENRADTIRHPAPAPVNHPPAHARDGIAG